MAADERQRAVRQERGSEGLPEPSTAPEALNTLVQAAPQ